ncbi:hypothetical protein MML48_2g00006521 [Holotrichia oblita]|uniref:Uncharacterized protein n=1 Tax=Holotrichia oblita TaxID=644536 RepID=A0ACB9TM79_HOLOL|nr:hypothetical protein MML48_2g00006521 [Holotrichia oblita]
MIFCEYGHETIMRRGKKEESSRILYMLPYNITPEGTNDICKLYEIISKLEEHTSVHKTKKIHAVTMGNLDSDYIRKCSECVFRDTEKEVQVMTNQTDTARRHKLISRTQATKNEKIIIKAEGKTYSDMLRTIKQNVNIDEVGIKVKTIKKIARGDIMMEVQGGKDKAEALRREIQNNNEGTQVKVKNRDEVIHVLGIDGDVTQKEIEEAIRKNVASANYQDITVLSCRPNQSGSQNATIALEKGLARDLVRKGSLRVGWVPCCVRARVNITRC